MSSTSSPLTLSFFDRDTAARARTQRKEGWEEFIERFKDPEPADTPKKELPLWAAVDFDQNHRQRANVRAVHALTLDVDKEPVPNARALRDELEGLQAAIHSSSSATKEKPRWRVVIPLSRPVSAEEYDALWIEFTRSLPFPVGTEAKDPSRGWYFPRKGEDGFYETFESEGDRLDVESWLEGVTIAAPGKRPEGPKPAPPANDAGPKTSDPARAASLAAASTLLGKAWPAEGRHQAQLALAGALYRSGWSEAAALEFLCDVCREAGDEDRAKRAATIRHTWSKGESGGQITGWTALESSLGSVIVGQARELLKRRDGERVKEKLKIRKAMEDSLEDNKELLENLSGGLGFTFGAWENEPPPVKFLVDGLIAEASVAMFFGRANTLKTWTLFDMALALANGRTWLGKFPTRKVRVGIVDYETGTANMARRLYMLRAGKCPNLGTVSFTKLKPNDEEFWLELEKDAFDIVFIDSLRRSNPGADENDSGESIVPLELAAEFAERTGCAVVYIHHAKKSSSDGWPEFRGNGSIEDQVDCSFACRRVDEDGKNALVEIKCIKPGDMKTPDDFAVRVEFNDAAKTATLRLGDSEKGAAKAAEDSEDSVRRAILLALSNSSFPTRDKLRERVGKNRDRFRIELEAMIAEKLVTENDAVGIIRDDDTKRTERVIAKCREVDNWESVTKLAKAAGVDPSFVDGMLRAGVIMKNASGRDARGFIVVTRDD